MQVNACQNHLFTMTCSRENASVCLVVSDKPSNHMYGEKGGAAPGAALLEDGVCDAIEGGHCGLRCSEVHKRHGLLSWI